MAVYADRWLFADFLCFNNLRRFAKTIYQCVECGDFVGGGRQLGDDGEFVVFDSAFFQARRVVNGAVVGDVDDHLNAIIQDVGAILLDEDFRRVLVVDFAHCLHCPEDAAERLGDGWRSLPLLEVLDVPFAGCGEVLKLPAKRQALIAVAAEERVDETREDADGGGGVEKGMGGRGGEDARLKSKAVVCSVLLLLHIA